VEVIKMYVTVKGKRVKKTENTLEHKCEYCSRAFYQWKSQLTGTRFCTKTCADKYQVKAKEVQCDYCGKSVIKKRSQLSRTKYSYCNNKCYRKGTFGARSGAWKGDAAGASAGRCRARRLYSLDGKKCTCDKPAEARHHKERNPRNNRSENIEFLCDHCHSVLHAKSYQKPHNLKLAAEQIKEIRSSPLPVYRLWKSGKYGVSYDTIKRIRSGRIKHTWVKS
jgi:hypothetical protein